MKNREIKILKKLNSFFGKFKFSNLSFKPALIIFFLQLKIDDFLACNLPRCYNFLLFPIFFKQENIFFKIKKLLKTTLFGIFRNKYFVILNFN